MNIKFINPVNYKDWDSLVLSAEGHSFFHSSCWARVLQECYGFQPLYITGFRNDKIVFLLPIMKVKHLFSPSKAVSLPFSDFCMPIVHEEVSLDEAKKVVIQQCRDLKMKSLEIRGDNPLFHDQKALCHFYSHKLDISRDFDSIFASFKDSNRRNIRKAQKADVHTHFYQSFESMNEYFRLHCMARKKHGLPPQPYTFFKHVFHHVINKKHGFVALSKYKNKTVAGAIFFTFGKEVLYKFGASDIHYQHLRMNNLLFWESVQYFAQNGYQQMSFGRTAVDNAGLRHFKQLWGTQEELIPYYKYNFNDKCFVQEDQTIHEFIHRAFRMMPIPLLRAIGALFYKYTA